MATPRQRKPAFTFMLPERMDTHISSAVEDMQVRLIALRDEEERLQASLSKLEERGAEAGRLCIAKMKNAAWTKKDHDRLNEAIQERRIIHPVLLNRVKEVNTEIEWISRARWKLVEGSIRMERQENETLEDIEEDDDGTLVGNQRDSCSTLVSSTAGELYELAKGEEIEASYNLAP